MGSDLSYFSGSSLQGGVAAAEGIQKMAANAATVMDEPLDTKKIQ